MPGHPAELRVADAKLLGWQLFGRCVVGLLDSRKGELVELAGHPLQDRQDLVDDLLLVVELVVGDEQEAPLGLACDLEATDPGHGQFDRPVGDAVEVEEDLDGDSLLTRPDRADPELGDLEGAELAVARLQHAGHGGGPCNLIALRQCTTFRCDGWNVINFTT